MHEGLVKRLKIAAEWADKGLIITPSLCLEAADAIEELEKKLFFQDITAAQVLEMYMPFFIPKWIPVTERLPEEPYGCLAIVWDNNVMTGDTFLNYYPEYIGFDGESWNDCDGEEIPLEVVYWMKMPKIPEPPMEKT